MQNFNSEGEFLRSWGGEGSGDGQFKGPDSIVLSPEGIIYITEKDNTRVQIFLILVHSSVILERGENLIQDRLESQMVLQSVLLVNIYVSDKLNKNVQKFVQVSLFK